MRIIKCDLCGEEVSRVVSLNVEDGEHPHNGSQMYKDIDCCKECLFRIKGLRVGEEYSALKLAMTENRFGKVNR